MADIEAIGVARSFGEEDAVAGVDLEVDSGEVHAIVGLNGAGKTTLMRLLLGMLRPDRGEVRLLGAPIGEDPRIWGEVGHMIERPIGYRELTVRQNLIARARLQGIERDEAGRLAARSIELFELDRWRDRKAGTLSLGNRQRLGIACALIHQPRVVILDEPSNGLDPAGVVFMRDLLEKMASSGTAVLVSSHHLDEIARIAHRISIMHRGRIVGSLDPAGVDLERQFFRRIHEADLVSLDGKDA